MQTEYLEEFVKVALHGSITQAARNMYMSQSTLSAHMSSLERDVGFKLFNRSSGSETTLTDAGARFLELSQKALNILEEARQQGFSLAQQKRPLRIGVQAGDLQFKELLHDRDGAQLVSLSGEGGLFDSVLYGIVDALLCADYSCSPELSHLAKKEGLVFEPLYCRHLGVAFSSGHPLASLEEIRIEDLSGYQHIVGPSMLVPLWNDLIRQLLGSEINVPGVWRPSSVGPFADSESEYGDYLIFGEPESLRTYYSDRDDITIVDMLSNAELPICTGLCYKSTNVSERLQKLVAELRREAAE